MPPCQGGRRGFKSLLPLHFLAENAPSASASTRAGLRVEQADGLLERRVASVQIALRDGKRRVARETPDRFRRSARIGKARTERVAQPVDAFGSLKPCELRDPLHQQADMTRIDRLAVLLDARGPRRAAFRSAAARAAVSGSAADMPPLSASLTSLQVLTVRVRRDRHAVARHRFPPSCCQPLPAGAKPFDGASVISELQPLSSSTRTTE